jgi:hypothetical protein
MHSRIGSKNPVYLEPDWTICRSFTEFAVSVLTRGVPYFVSFDHDLADIHYDPETQKESFAYDEKTGYDCAKWLAEYCREHDIRFPEWAVHSMNPVGTQNITKYLKNLGL